MYSPHFGSPRAVQVGQRIHESVFHAIYNPDASYIPFARLNLGTQWDSETLREFMEEDPYTSATAIISKIRDFGSEPLSEAIADAFIRQTSSDAGLRSITEFPGSLDIVLNALRSYRAIIVHAGRKQQLAINSLVKVLAIFPHQPKATRKVAYHTLRGLVSLAKPQTDSLDTILERIGREPFYGQKACIASVAFTADGKRIISGSDDKLIRVWDAETGDEVTKPLEGHVWPARADAVLPDDTRIVAALSGETVETWRGKTGRNYQALYLGHHRVTRPAAISSDRRRMALGLWDGTIEVRDVAAEMQTMTSLKLEGHTDGVWSVAFSPDSSRLASGSWDKTVRLWDASTGKQLLEPLRGHSESVWTVAFSPDGKHVASGSEDCTACVWDAGTGQQVGEAYSGQSNCVFSLVFTPDGKHIVSGSDDWTIHIWEVETGHTIHSLRGHTGWVTSVAISPDGTRIVSGAEDMTIRLWDAHTGEQLLQPVDSTRPARRPW
ncbi:hypothetical protein HGRIS_006719 [Hohenbuehelia grisea]|uniref:WD40 repeat-like protein n=1 Tax=Hohenbuehelia grisea TaxID=104357 RepID=A0ABR3JBD1_9AGAR